MTFSIITTVLNNERFVLDCLKSVQKQNFNKKKIRASNYRWRIN